MARKSITVLCGPNGSARAGRIDQRLRESAGSALLLVPSVRQAKRRREQFFSAEGCPGAWGAPVLSLKDFAQDLVSREGVVVTNFESGFQQRLLMEHCLREVAVELPETSLVRIRQTPGLIRHLVSVVNDLKQAAIEPDVFATRLEQAEYTASLDEGVAAVYALYQEAMQEAGLYDVPGLYWHADYFAGQGCPKVLEGIDTLLLDGFDDFTPSEFRLLHSLSDQVERMEIGLNVELAPDRQDRYTLTLHTLRQLQEHFDCQVVECEAPAMASWSDFAAQRIFWREEPVVPENLRANLTIVPCSDGVHEVESIARRVKKRIVDEGVSPTDIAVVYWNMTRVADTLRSVFSSFGIPCQLATQRTLSESRLGRTLLNLFSTTDWEREGILEPLQGPYLASVIGPVPEAAAYYAQRAQILKGYKDWAYRLERLKKQVERGEREDARALLKRHPEAVAELDGLLSAIAALSAIQQELPEEATQYDYAVKLDGLLKKLAPAERNAYLEEEDPPAREGIRSLLELLADAPGSDVVAMGRDEFLTRFNQGLDELSFSLPGAAGGVACLDASQVRNERFAHVYVGGLNEGQAPAPPAGNAVYPERDRERLNEAHIPIESNQEHHARQRMLFGHVLESADESLFLSWQLVQDSGREASPSPFLTDVRELFPPSLGVVEPYPKADSFLPEPDVLACQRDVMNRALYSAPELVEAFSELCAPGVVGASVESSRQSDEPFGPFDGVLTDPDLVESIASAYGESHEFSVNQLETWLSCPFNFYVNRVLHLEEGGAPDSTVGALIRGSLLHDVLEAFHQQFAGLHIRDIGLGKADESMAELVEAAFDAYDWNECAAPRGAVLAEKLHLLRRLQRYLRVEHTQEEEQPWKPTWFEVAFGRSASAEGDAPSTVAPFVMTGSAGPVRFTGRIDRIDRDGDRVRLIDYKSGSVPAAGEITGGQSIQLSVYAEAVERHVLPDTECVEARYLAVGKRERREALGLAGKGKWPDRVGNMHEAIARAVAGIRRGYFPPERGGKTCFGCGQVRACRHEDARIARKLGLPETDGEEGA